MDLHFDDNNNLSLKRFERMLKTNSIFFFDSAEFERIIVYYIDNGKLNLAKKAIELALDQHPEIIAIRTLKAELLILEDKFSEAEKLLSELEHFEPTNIEIYIQKALLFSKQDKHIEAIQIFELALHLTEDETDLEIFSLLGMEYLYMENFEKAIIYFKKCLDIEPEDQSSLYNIVYCYDMLDSNEVAIQFLQNYIDSQPYSETGWHQLGREYYNLGKYNEAIKSFDFAILIDDNFVGAYLEKAKTLEKLERYYDAIDNYNKCNKLDDPSAFSYLRIGVCYENLQQIENAIAYYKKSAEQDPYLDKPILNIISILFQQREYQKSIFYINQLINLEEENLKYWRLYGHANMKIAFFSEAAKAFQKCLLLKDNSIDIYLELADAQYFLGDLGEAIKSLIKAEIYFHNNAEIQYRLSGLYFLIKSNDLGVKYLRDAFRIKPNIIKSFQKLFPSIYNTKGLQNLIQNLNSGTPF